MISVKSLKAFVLLHVRLCVVAVVVAATESLLKQPA